MKGTTTPPPLVGRGLVVAGWRSVEHTVYTWRAGLVAVELLIGGVGIQSQAEQALREGAIATLGLGVVGARAQLFAACRLEDRQPGRHQRSPYFRHTALLP